MILNLNYYECAKLTYSYIYIIQWHAKILNTLQSVEFSKYYMIDNYQTWSEYSNIIGFFTDNRYMNKKYYFFINSEIFKITLRKSLDTFNYSLISLSHHYNIAFKLLWLCFMMECNCSAKHNSPHHFVNSGCKIKFIVLWPTCCLPWPTGKISQMMFEKW